MNPNNSTGEGKKCNECQFEVDRYGEHHSQACSKRTWGPPPSSPKEEYRDHYAQGHHRGINIGECSSPKDNKPQRDIIESKNETGRSNGKQLVTPTTNKECCSKCVVKGFSGFPHCVDPIDCPCHSVPTINGWEEEFDRTWKSNTWYWEEIKDFIRDLLATEREKAYKEGWSNGSCDSSILNGAEFVGRTQTKEAILSLIEGMSEPNKGSYVPDAVKYNSGYRAALTDLTNKIKEI